MRRAVKIAWRSRKGLRRILSVPYNTHSDILYGLSEDFGSYLFFTSANEVGEAV